MGDGHHVEEMEADLQVVMVSGKRLSFGEKIGRFMVRHTLLLYVIGWVMILSLSAVSVVVGWFAINPIGEYDWYIADSIENQRLDAFEDALDRNDLQGVKEIVAPRSELSFLTNFMVMVTTTSDNVFTGRMVQSLCEFQRLLTSLQDFPKFCTTNAPDGLNTACVSQGTDLVARFYPTIAGQLECALMSDEEVTSIVTNETSTGSFDFFLTKSGTKTTTRSMFGLGGPLGNDTTPNGITYNETTHESTTTQGKLYLPLLQGFEDSVFEKFGLSRSLFKSPYNNGPIDLGNGVSISFANGYLLNEEVNTLINRDQLLAAFSLLLVGFFVFLKVGSLFVTVNAMISILCSVTVGVFIYSGVLGIDYFNVVHVVIIFLAIGIGADDLFVLSDAFRQSETLWVQVRGYQTPQKALDANIYGTGDAQTEVLVARITYAWMRALGSVFNTSFTTFVAFMATGISPIAPVSFFGYFAAIVILVLYIFTLTLFPLLILIDHKYLRGKPFCFPCCRKGKVDLAGGAHRKQDVLPPRTIEDKLIQNLYLPFILYEFKSVKVVAIASVVLFLGLFVGMAVSASKLSTPTKNTDSFTSSHMFYKFFDHWQSVYKVGGDDEERKYDGYVRTKIVFGVSGIDRIGFNPEDPSEVRGVARFDPMFDIAPKAAQAYILDLCTSLETVTCDVPGCLERGKPFAKQLDCTMQYFHEWHAAQFPNETQAIDLGDENRTLFLQRLKEFAVDQGQHENVGFINGDLKFFVLRYYAAILYDQPAVERLDVVENVQRKWFQEQKPSAPPSLQSMFQIDYNINWLVTEVGIIKGMFQGLLISLPIGFLVLLVSTWNVAVSFLAMMSVMMIVVFVLGSMNLMGLSLGIAEAIAAVMSVGLSLDHVVHMAGMYAHAANMGFQNRIDRTIYAVDKMGTTLISATITTAVSAFVMFFAIFIFFRVMGTLISLTVTVAFFYCFLFFVPLLLFIGPQNNQCVLPKMNTIQPKQ